MSVSKQACAAGRHVLLLAITGSGRARHPPIVGVNLRPRQIGKFISEVLTLGFPDVDGAVVLFAPDQKVPDGGRLF